MHRASVHRSGRLGRDADKGYIREHESYYLGFFVPCGRVFNGVALAVRLPASVWKVVWKIDISVRVTSFLTAATLGLLVGFQFTKDYAIAAMVGGIVIGTYFGLRLLA